MPYSNSPEDQTWPTYLTLLASPKWLLHCPTQQATPANTAAPSPSGGLALHNSTCTVVAAAPHRQTYQGPAMPTRYQQQSQPKHNRRPYIAHTGYVSRTPGPGVHWSHRTPSTWDHSFKTEGIADIFNTGIPHFIMLCFIALQIVCFFTNWGFMATNCSQRMLRNF